MLRFATLCLVLLMGTLPPSASRCSETSRERYESRTFLGYACADDCERHKAGFGLAERFSMTDPRQCAPLPQAEAEGCAAFVAGARDAEAAGDRWAVENEVLRPCQCEGAGERFRSGCMRSLQGPWHPSP